MLVIMENRHTGRMQKMMFRDKGEFEEFMAYNHSWKYIKEVKI